MDHTALVLDAPHQRDGRRIDGRPARRTFRVSRSSTWPPGGQRAVRVLLKATLFLGVVIAATWLSHLVREALSLDITPGNEQQMHRALMLGTLVYIFLLALPFVPGAEIGIAMLTAFGASIAPLVYTATVLAMMLSYTAGRVVPPDLIARLLSLLRMRRAADLVGRLIPLPGDARLALLLDAAEPGLVTLALRQRYVALGLLLNLPGNAVIGGGGGIMLAAGLSGLFAPFPTAVAIAVAVSPVPLAIILLGG